MAKDPAFLFYTGDFQTGTQFFTDEQVGKYMRLLMAQHQHGPLTEKQVLHICKSHDEEVMAKFARDEEGRFFNERLQTEIDKRKGFIDSRSRNKLGKTKSHENHVKSVSETYGKRMEDENENRDEVKKTEVADSKIDHETFLRNLFAENETAQAHREALHLAARVEVTKDHARKFNASLLTESKHHTEEKEWRKHFRNWLTKGGHKVGYDGKEEATDFNFKLISKKQ